MNIGPRPLVKLELIIGGRSRLVSIKLLPLLLTLLQMPYLFSLMLAFEPEGDSNSYLLS